MFSYSELQASHAASRRWTVKRRQVTYLLQDIRALQDKYGLGKYNIHRNSLTTQPIIYTLILRISRRYLPAADVINIFLAQPVEPCCELHGINSIDKNLKQHIYYLHSFQ